MDLCRTCKAQIRRRIQSSIHEAPSASQTAAAKFLDTISKLPGMAGETGDSFSAYTQVKMTEASRLLHLPKEECPEIGSRFHHTTKTEKLGQY